MKISRLAVLAVLPLVCSCSEMAIFYAMITPHKEAEAIEEAKELVDEAADYEAKNLDPTIEIK